MQRRCDLGKVTQLKETRPLPLACCVTRGLELTLSRPPFLHLDKEGWTGPFLQLRWTFVYLLAWPDSASSRNTHPGVGQMEKSLWDPESSYTRSCPAVPSITVLAKIALSLSANCRRACTDLF